MRRSRALRLLPNGRAATPKTKTARLSADMIWRILMPRTRNHVYYRVDDSAGEVEVLLVWNAIAGSDPDV